MDDQSRDTFAETADIATGSTTDARGVELGLLADNLGFHIRIASIALERALKRLAGEDMRMGYFPVLLIIKLNPQATQTAIAEAVGLRRSSLVPILKKLEQFGWIERSGHEGDKRANRIRLTPKGEKACTEIACDVEGIEDSARAALGNRSYTRLVDLLKEVQVIFGER
jgi:DNA-binding MarR family transcriptional regulator